MDLQLFSKSQDIGINVTGCRIFNISVKMAGFMIRFMKNVSGRGRVKIKTEQQTNKQTNKLRGGE